MKCANCERVLNSMEVGLTKKLINRGAVSCYCLTCLAAQFRVTEEQLKDMAEAFRMAGCTLFR